MYGTLRLGDDRECDYLSSSVIVRKAPDQCLDHASVVIVILVRCNI